MAWYHKFPWTNFHELNLDWILEICGKAEKSIPDIDAAISRANTAADDAETRTDAAVSNANTAADLANHNAVNASEAATRANIAAGLIEPVTAVAVTVEGGTASASVTKTNPGMRFNFEIPRGERGEPGQSGGESDLLDNGYFVKPINQRGAESYTGTGAKVYTIDRWFTTSSASPALTVNGNSITVAPGATIQQVVPADMIPDFPSDAGVGFTAVARTTAGVVHYANSSHTDTLLSVTIEDVTGNIVVTLGPGTWEYCALYRGVYAADSLPGYNRKQYATDLLACKRYYRKYSTTTLSGWINGSGNTIILGCDNTDMRVVPTVTATVDSGKCAGSNIASDKMSAPSATACELRLTLSDGSAYSTQTVAVRFTSLALSADM